MIVDDNEASYTSFFRLPHLALHLKIWQGGVAEYKFSHLHPPDPGIFSFITLGEGGEHEKFQSILMGFLFTLRRSIPAFGRWYSSAQRNYLGDRPTDDRRPVAGGGLFQKRL